MVLFLRGWGGNWVRLVFWGLDGRGGVRRGICMVGDGGEGVDLFGPDGGEVRG